MLDFVFRTRALSYLHLRDTASIPSTLMDTAASQLVHSLITSHLDYCNSVLVGCPQYCVKKLQRVQNMAVRIVICSDRDVSSRLLLQSLHWLSVKQQINYKILIMTL